MCVDHLKIFSGMLDEPIIHPSIVETHPKLNKKKQSTFMYYKNTKAILFGLGGVKFFTKTGIVGKQYIVIKRDSRLENIKVSELVGQSWKDR